jgi:FkbM family methyltransferase
MNLLTRNSKIYREIRFLRQVTGAAIRGNVKPLIGYIRYLSLENKLKYPIKVEMKPLDEIINEETIDLIKIDVEGVEDLVLEGARNLLKRTKMIIIEKNKESFSNAYKILKEEGFKFRKFLDHNVLFTK